VLDTIVAATRSQMVVQVGNGLGQSSMVRLEHRLASGRIPSWSVASSRV
jgi:hypothetical protein